MPIGGIVITVHPDDRKDVEVALASFLELTVYGSDEKGNIICMLTGSDADSIHGTIQEIEMVDAVVSVTLAYLNEEDEQEDRPAAR